MTLAILTANWAANVGGITRTVSALLESLRVQCDENVVLVALGAHVAAPEGLPAPEVEVEGEKIKRAVSTFQALRRIRPTLAHVNDDFYMALGTAIYRLLHPQSNKMVYTIHTLQDRSKHLVDAPLRHFRQEVLRAIRSLGHVVILASSDRVVVLTQAMLDQMSPLERWIARRKVVVIPFGVTITPPSVIEAQNFREAFSLDERWPILCSIGVFFHDWKVRGHEVIIDAVARLRADYPGILLLIVGDGQHRRRLEQRIHDKGLDRNVRITGYLPNSYAALACADVYTHMALYEAQGVAIVEAMLAGKPIVAANRGGIPEVVPDGEAALLLEPDPEAVEQALRRLLTDPALADRLAAQARNRALKRFAPESTTQAYLALFEELKFTGRRVA